MFSDADFATGELCKEITHTENTSTTNENIITTNEANLFSLTPR